MKLKNKVEMRMFNQPAGKITRGYILDEYIKKASDDSVEKAYILPSDTLGVRELYSQGFIFNQQVRATAVLHVADYLSAAEIYINEEED